MEGVVGARSYDGFGMGREAPEMHCREAESGPDNRPECSLQDTQRMLQTYTKNAQRMPLNMEEPPLFKGKAVWRK